MCVEINTDGPTRVLSVRDEKEFAAFSAPDDGDWTNISLKQLPNIRSYEKDKGELQFTLKVAGFGISIISRIPPQELIFIQFSNIVGEMVLTPTSKKFCISIENVQCDNQLLEAPIPVFLYVTPPGFRGADEAQSRLPALEFRAEMQPILNENAVIFKVCKILKFSIFIF